MLKCRRFLWTDLDYYSDRKVIKIRIFKMELERKLKGSQENDEKKFDTVQRE